MTTIKVTRAGIRSLGGYSEQRGVRWYYNLPERLVTMPDGRIAAATPGGYSSKAETLTLVRSLYAERPLLVEWPDGKTSTIKR
jgi:hypothetical protein